MIATTEPLELTQGDTVQWQKTFADYPSSEWTVSYNIRGASSLDVTATQNNDGITHSVLLSSAQTADLKDGNYWWQAVAVHKSTSERATVSTGDFLVKPDLAILPEGYDGRSHTKKTLDALEAIIENRASLDQQSYSINGRSLSRMDVAELLSWHSKYKGFYQAELRRAGKGKSSKIQTRFNT